MIEKPESLDIWTIQDVFLTPPTSPCLAEMHIGDLESIDDISAPTFRKTESMIIKDCMWGASENHGSRFREHAYTRSYVGELPLPGKLPAFMDNSEISSKFLHTVDPAEVFPSVSALEERIALRDISSPESDEESDADVDVVTVDTKAAEMKALQQSVEILTPPNTPDSEPTENTKIFNDAAPMEVVVTTRTSQSPANDSSVSENVSKRSKEVTALSERFSRASHNVLERKRRNELKGKFYSLRDCIPDLSGNKKIPKVVILKKAISYIESIKGEESTLKTELQRHRKTNQELRRRLSAILKDKSR